MLKVELTSWLKQIEKDSKRVQEQNKKIFIEAVTLLKDRIMEYTPVGNPTLWHYPAHKNYTPGFLRSNWKLEIKGDVAIITNDAPYAERVEYHGWSTQAPDGMMRRGVMDYQLILKQVSK